MPPDNKLADAATGRRRRAATTNALRKERKDDSIQKRRRAVQATADEQNGASSTSSAETTNAKHEPGVYRIHNTNIVERLKTLQRDTDNLNSDQRDLQLHALTRFRKLLSFERNPPITEVIGAGVIPRLVQFLHCHDDPRLAFEATWVLTNVASGTSEHARVIIDYGAVPALVRLVTHPSAAVREQAMWALGNITGDSPRCRDLVLSYGIIEPLLVQCHQAIAAIASHAAAAAAAAAVASEPSAGANSSDNNFAGSSQQLLRNATWLISNLCRFKPAPRAPLIEPLIPAIVTLLNSSTDEEVLSDCCWAFSYLSESADRVANVIGAGALPLLVRLLGSPSHNVHAPALRTVANVVAGSNEELAAALNAGAIEGLGQLLQAAKRETRKEACWMASNLAAGTPEQVRMLCGSGVVPRLLEMASTEEFDVKKEAGHALCNICVYGDPTVVREMWIHGVLGAIVELLGAPDVALVGASLAALEAVLCVGCAGAEEEQEMLMEKLEEAGLHERLEPLQLHREPTISESATKMLDAIEGVQSRM